MPTAFAELEALEQSVRDAETALQDAEQSRRRRQRERDAVGHELQAFYASGDVHDKEKLAGLQRQMEDLQAGLVPRTVSGPDGARVEMVDVEAEGRVAGAYSRVEDAKNAVTTFIIDERKRLQAELVERSIALPDEILEAAQALFAAAGKWRGVRNQWITLGEFWGVAPAEVPLLPLPGLAMDDIHRVLEQAQGGARDRRGLYPMPVRLAPGSGSSEEVKYAADLEGWAHVPRVLSSAGLPGGPALLGA